VTTQLHQMNISYIPKEDRLLLKISTKTNDEYRLWLTRRYCSLLIKLFKDEIDKFGGEPTVAASDEARKMYKDGAFEKTYEAEGNSFPLGEDGVLAFRINKGDSSNGNIALELSPEEGQGINLNLNKTLIYMFNNILMQGVQQAGWNLLDPGPSSRKVH
jgi:hypothetical protein